MANLSALASNAQDIIYLSASGTGAIDDPFVSHFTVEGIDLVATEDTLQAVKIKLDTLPVVANRVSVTTELDQPLTDTQLRLAPIEVVVAAGTDSIGSISNTTFNAIQSGSWDVSVNNLPTTFEITDPIPVTGSVEISNDIDSPITISGNVTANTGLTQPLTDTQLRASSVDTNITNASIAVTGAFYPATQPVSLTTLPALATGSNVIGSISNTSFAVSNFPVTQAITATTLPLPTGAATASNQSTIIGHVDGIEGLLATIDADTSLLSSTIASSKIQVDVVTAPTTTVSDGGSSLTVDGVVELGASTLIALGSNSGTTEITNDAGNPIPVNGTVELGATTLASLGNNNGTTEITNDVGNPIPVSASSLPLPTGAASESTLNSVNAKLPSNLTVTSTRLLVDGSGVTQPISGTVTANTGLTQPLTDTQLRANPISVDVTNYAALVTALEAATLQANVTNNVSVVGDITLDTAGQDLATATNQSLANTYLYEVDNKLPAGLTVTSTRLLVDGSGVTQPVSGTVTANTGLVQPLTDTELRSSPVSVTLAGGTNSIGSISNTSFNVGNFPSSQAITATALPLPTGAATSEKQDTGNTSLNSIDTKTPALGQALAAASVPVVLTAEQVTTLTPPTSVSVSNLPATQPVSLAALPALATGSNIIGSIGNTVFDATQSGNWDVSVNNFPTTVEVSNDGGNPLAISGTVTADIGLDQPLTDTQLRASPVPIVEGLSIPTYDHMSLSYSGNNLSQVIYKVGGVNGTTVATLDLSYDSNNNITSITKV